MARQYLRTLQAWMRTRSTSQQPSHTQRTDSLLHDSISEPNNVLSRRRSARVAGRKVSFVEDDAEVSGADEDQTECTSSDECTSADADCTDSSTSVDEDEASSSEDEGSDSDAAQEASEAESESASAAGEDEPAPTGAAKLPEPVQAYATRQALRQWARAQLDCKVPCTSASALQSLNDSVGKGDVDPAIMEDMRARLAKLFKAQTTTAWRDVQRAVASCDKVMRSRFSGAGKGPGRPAANKPVPARPGKEGHMNEISVTVILTGSDLPQPLFDDIEQWCAQHTAQAVFGYERGGNHGNGHAQGVVRTTQFTTTTLTKHLKAYLRQCGTDQGLPAQAMDTIHVLSRRLTNRGVHTWLGMVGYCMKDMHQPHFRSIIHIVSEAELTSGRLQHMMKGAGPLKKREALTLHTMMAKMATFQELHMSRVCCGPDRVLLRMIRSGNFYPSANWAMVPGHGLHISKMDAIWKVTTMWREVTLEDVHTIFFTENPNGRYFSRLSRLEFPDNAMVDKEQDPVTDWDEVLALRGGVAHQLRLFGEDGQPNTLPREEEDAAHRAHNNLLRRAQQEVQWAFGANAQPEVVVHDDHIEHLFDHVEVIDQCDDTAAWRV